MAAVIPEAVKSNIPINSPTKPVEEVLPKAPWMRECPKEVIGSNAPPPQYRINKS